MSQNRMPASEQRQAALLSSAGGPASLSVARDLVAARLPPAPCSMRPQGRRHDAAQIPKFRAADSVIDEETDYILDLGLELKGGTRIDQPEELLAENYDAIFVGSGAPRGRELEIPGRKEAGANYSYRHRMAASVSFRACQQDRQARDRARRRNTAMDCCRTARRLGGEDVKVIVRPASER